MRGDGEWPADLTCGDAPLELDVLGPETKHEADHEDPATPLHSLDDSVRVLRRQRDRLLEEDVLAFAESPLRGLSVKVGGEAPEFSQPKRCFWKAL